MIIIFSNFPTDGVIDDGLSLLNAYIAALAVMILTFDSIVKRNNTGPTDTIAVVLGVYFFDSIFRFVLVPFERWLVEIGV